MIVVIGVEKALVQKSNSVLAVQLIAERITVKTHIAAILPNREFLKNTLINTNAIGIAEAINIKDDIINFSIAWLLDFSQLKIVKKREFR